MYGQDITQGQKVNVGEWVNGEYAGAAQATVTVIHADCDLRTQGTVTVVYLRSGLTAEVGACLVNPVPVKAVVKQLNRTRKARSSAPVKR